MKGTDASLCYIPINEMSLGRGPSSLSGEPKAHHAELNCFYSEDGQVETAKLGHADTSELTELMWLKELLLLCSDYRTFKNMDNRQGMRIKTNLSTGMEKPKRRTGRFVCPVSPLLKMKEAPKSKPMTSISPNRKSLEERRHRMSTSLEQERQNINNSRFGKDDSKLPRRAKISEQGSSSLNRKCPLSYKEDGFGLSDYDGTCSRLDMEPRTEDIHRNVVESQISSQNKAEAQSSERTPTEHVMRTIEEVESIISWVSLTRSNWIKTNGGNESLSMGGRRLEQIQTQDEEDHRDSSRLVDELRCLGEELSESLQRALRMEAENKDWLSPCIQREHEIDYKNSPLESSRRSMRMPLYHRHNSTSGEMPYSSSTSHNVPTNPCLPPLSTTRHALHEEDICDQHTLWTSSAKDSWSEKENLNWTNHRWREETQKHRCLSESDVGQDGLLSSDEALQKGDEFWQQEMEESQSFRRWFTHPSRPKLIDFLRITAPEDDISRTPSPLFPELRSEATSPVEGEERTPGRLQAVWPPLKQEKVGLKYTEAEHQAAILQLKRECKEEVEKLQEDFSRKLSKLKEESGVTVSRLEMTLSEMQVKLSQLGTLTRGELRDVAVSTHEDTLPHKTFRAVCIQTDRETFIKKCECTQSQQRVTSKKLDLASISLSLAGQREAEPPCQFFGHHAPSNTINPPPSFSSPTLTHKQTSKAAPPPPPPPPPPAPFLSYAAPPPPPSSTPSSLLATPRKPAREPSRPMKPLYWTRIQIDDNKNNTLWNVLEEPHVKNAVEFEDLFAKTTTQLKRKPLLENYKKKAKAKKIVKLLDGKRSQAVGILISSLHLEMKDIRQAILMVDNSVVDLETIEALYENRAQPEELEKIKTHYNTSKEEELKHLDKPEQFLHELSQIPDFAGRARCIIFKAAFNDAIASVQHKLDIVLSVCETLVEKEGVKEVLGLILALGNHMNGGNRIRGQADGFGLEILPKLKDVKSRDNRISLVDYVVSYYLHNVDKNAGTDKSAFPLPEPQDVFLAAQLNFEDLNAELRRLGRDLAGCEKDVQKVCSASPEEHLQPFKDRMETFLLSARKEHAGASYQFTTAQKSFQDLCAYFGLKPKAGEKEVTSTHFFMLWFEFCADFKARWKRENRNFTKERLKEAQHSVKKITAEKKVETRKIIPNSLKERLRRKEANLNSI